MLRLMILHISSLPLFPVAYVCIDAVYVRVKVTDIEIREIRNVILENIQQKNFKGKVLHHSIVTTGLLRPICGILYQK